VGKPEYTPPELQNARFSEWTAGRDDRFRPGVLIFQLLMQGTHPFLGIFTGQGEPGPIPERIRSGLVAVLARPEVPFRPNPHAPPFTVLPPQVRDLIVRCFEKGHCRHEASRPGRGVLGKKGLGQAEEELQTLRSAMRSTSTTGDLAMPAPVRN